MTTRVSLDEAIERFEDYLSDESQVVIMNLEYQAAYVLRLCDPAAYRELFWQWVDAEELDVHYDLHEPYRLP